MGIAAIDLFDGQRWWPLNTRSPFRLRWFLGKSFVGSRIIFVSIEDERWFFYFGTISGNYTCHIFISSTSVLDLGRVCILLFFPLIFWCSNISQALKFWCVFFQKIESSFCYESAVCYIEQAVFSQQKNRSVFWFVAACWLVLWGSCKLQESNHVRCIWLWSLVSFSHVWPCQFDTQAMKRSSLLAHSLYLAAVSHNYARKHNCCVPSINRIICGDE